MNSTGKESRHLGIHIDRSAADVYAYASDPANLPAWAHGLGATIEKVADTWIADSSPLGRVTVAFTPDNDLGVLDHRVTLPSGRPSTTRSASSPTAPGARWCSPSADSRGRPTPTSSATPAWSPPT